MTMLLAGWSALVSVAFIPAAPFFAIPLLFLDLVILWAVIVHGAEVGRRA